MLEHLRVPRDREGRYQTEVLSRYQRRQEGVNRMVRQMFLTGVSTRKVTEVLEPLLGASMSAQTVSRITRSLDAEVRRYQSRPLEDKYLYLLLDGIVLKVKNRHRRCQTTGVVRLRHYPRGSPGDDLL